MLHLTITWASAETRQILQMMIGQIVGTLTSPWHLFLTYHQTLAMCFVPSDVVQASLQRDLLYDRHLSGSFDVREVLFAKRSGKFFDTLISFI